MTNRTLSYILRGIDLSSGKLVRRVGNLTAILIENHKSEVKASFGIVSTVNDYLVLLKDGAKAGIILKCGTVDIHVYVYPKYRKQHIVRRLISDGFLKDLWSDIESVSCVNWAEFHAIKHLAEIAGFSLANEQQYYPID